MRRSSSATASDSWRQTARKNGPFRYATYEEAKEKLNPQDAEALCTMLKSVAEAEEIAVSATLVKEPTSRSRQGDLPVESEMEQTEPGRQSRQGDRPVDPYSGQAQPGRQSRQGDLPAEGVDPEFDALLFALTAIRFDNILQALDAGPGSAEVSVITAAQWEHGLRMTPTSTRASGYLYAQRR